jgi:hypothetical protein
MMNTYDPALLTSAVLKEEYDILKGENPLNTSRLKKNTVLEYLKERYNMLELKSKEVKKAKELLDKQRAAMKSMGTLPSGSTAAEGHTDRGGRDT